MSDKLVVDVDSSDAVLATKQMEALTGAVISMGEAFKSAKGSTAALKELRSLLVGLKGKGSAFDELSAAIKDLNRNSDLLRSSFETSIGQLNRTLKAEMAELKAQLRTDALEAGRQMGNGLEEGLKEADAKVKRQGRTLAATARAEATRVYEAMVAGQANAKVKDPAVLGQLQEAGATLSPYHKQVLANWKESQKQMLKALKKQLDEEEAATQQLLASQASASGQLSAGAGGTAAAAAGRARAEGYTNAFGVYISRGTQEAEAAAMKALSAGSTGVASAAAAGKARAEGYTNAFGVYVSKSISDKIKDAEAAGVRALSAGAGGTAASAAGRARAEGYTNAFGVYISKGTQEAEAAAMKALSAGSAGVASAAAAGRARAEGYTNAFGIYISKSISEKIKEAEAAGARALSAGSNGVAAAAAARPRAVTTNSLGLVVPPIAQDIPKQTQEVEGLSKAFKKLAIDGNDAHSMARGLASAFNLLWLTWGNLAPLFTGAGISFGIKKTFDIGSEVEYQIKMMEALGQTVDSTGKEFVGMGSAIRAELRNIDQETQFSLVELSKAMVQLGQAGKTPQEALQMLRPAAGLASLGMTDLKTSIDLLIQTQALFNKTSADTAKIASQVFQATKSGVLNVGDIGDSMRYASEANTRFGKSLEETLALLGALAQAGLRGASGGTALINFFRDLNGRSGPAIKAMGELERATGQQIKVFDELGHQRSAVDIFTDIANASKKLKAEEADKLLAKIFSDRGGRTFFAMIREGTIDLQKMVTEYKNVDPNAFFMAAKGLMDTTKGAMDILQGSLVGVFDAVFEGFSSQFKQAIVDVTAVIDSGGFKQAVAGIVGGVLGLYEAIKTVSPAIITFFSLWAGYKAITIGIGIFQSLAMVLAGLAPTLAMSTKGYLQQTFAVEANSIAIIGNVAAQRAHALGMDASAVAAERLAATQTVLAASSGAAGLAVRGLTAAIAFLANPIVGIVATLGMLGFAWYESSEAAKRASGDTTGTVLRDGKLNVDQWNKEIALLRTRSALLGQDSYAPKEAELKTASDNLNTLIADYDKLQARISAREKRGDTAANLNWLRQEADKKLSVIVAQETAINKAYSDINAARNEEAAAQARKEYEMERKRREAESRLRGTIVPEKPVKAGSVREERLRLQNDNELKQIEARLKSELNLNATYYSTEKSQLEARYNANIISVAEYQSEYTRLTKEAEQKRIAIYGESSDKYGKALADRFSAMQQAFTSQIKGSQVSDELQGIIADVNASLESGAQAYSSYYEAAAAGDYSAQETLAASLSNSKTALDAYIESLRNYVDMQPEGPTKKLAAEMLNAAQAAATFQQANADAIQGSHVKMVEDARKAYYDLAKMVGEASRSSQEFWKKERNELAEQKAVEALEQQYRFLNESVFSSDVATKAAAFAREKAISKYRQEMEKLNTAAKKAEDAVTTWATEYGAAIASGNKEAIKTLGQLIELRDKMNGDRADFVAEAAASTEDLTLAAFEKARREQIEAWSSELGDAIQTSIFEGGKAGGEKFIAILRRELLTKPLQAFINATINAVTGGLMNGLVGGAVSGAASSFGGSLLGSAAGSLTGNWLGAGSAMGMLGNIGAGVTTGMGTLFTEGFSAWVSQATGLMGAGSMGGGLGALLGPVALLGGAAMLLSSFDKSGTPHYGAAAEYSSGKTTGTEAMFLANKGISGQYSKGAQSGVSAVAAGAGAALDAISKMFGGAGGYKISTAYSDDSSSDPGFGSLKITQGSKTVTDWGDTRTSKWADKIFADGEEGVKLYTQAVAQDVRQAMVDMGLPDWAKKILTDLGDEIDLTALSNALTKISQTQAAFTGLNDSLDGFARLSGEAKLSIMDAAGGVEALAAYNELVGNTGAQVAQAMQTLSDTLTEAGADAVPTTVYALQKMLNTLDLTSEEGQKLAATLISVAPALKSITEALDTAMQNRSTLYGGYGLTAKAFEDLSAQFDLLGYQVPETSSQYRELIAAQVAMGDAGTATLISLSNLVPAWEAYNQQLEDTRQRLVTFWSGLSSSLSSIESQLASLGDTVDDGGAQAAYQAAMTTYNAEMEIYNRLSNAQNSILDFVSSLTSGTLSELGIAQLSLEQMQSRFASDLQAAMEGDADATEKLIKSSKSLLDAQIKRSSTGVEARRAAAQMAIALGNLPKPTEPVQPTAPKTPKEDKTKELLNLFKENLLAIKDLVRAIHENEMSIDLRLNLEEAANQFKVTLDAILNADISDSLKAFATRINTGLTKMLTVTITAGIDDEAFVAQVSDTVKALSKAIELTVTSVLDEGSMKAMLQSIENTRVTLQVVLDSKVSNDIKNIANEVLEGVGVIIQKAVTTPGMSKDDILTVYGLNEALNKVVNLTVSTDKIPDDLRALVLESATTSTKTIQLAIENFKGTDKDIIFAAEADALKTIQLAVASGNPDAIKLATTESNAISVVVAAYAKEGKLPDDIAKLLQEGDTQKIIDVALKIEASKYKMEVDSLLAARDVEVKLSMGDTTAIKTAVDALTAQQSITFAAVFSGSESTAAEIANLAKAQDVVYQAHVDAGDAPQKLAELAKAQDVTLTAVLADAIALEAKAALAADSKLTITAALDSAQAELQKAVLAQDPGLVITPELQAAIAESALAQLTATRQADVAVTADTTEAETALAEVTTGNTAMVDAVVDTTHIITELSTAAAGPYTATINATTAGVSEVASAISSVASASYPATVQVTESGSSDVASAISSVAGASYSATVAVAESGVSEVASALSAVAGASYPATVAVTESGLEDTSDAITEVAEEDYKAIIKVIEQGSAAAAATIRAVAGASYTATINTTHVITTIHETINRSPSSPTPSALGNIFSGGLVPFANGGVFGSITPFAKGGLPTNSIINSPMLFDMGLAGEAGPEAIMPLSRDSRGRLGVKVIGDNAPKVAVAESDNVSEELLANLLEELSAVKEELQGLRAEAASTATSSYKTAKLLTRAMPDGRAILTTSTV